jgi:glycosyltransferase involved in cell wall biosynthesis
MIKKKKVAFLLGAASNEGGIARVTSILTDALYKQATLDIHIISYVNVAERGYSWNKDLIYHALFENRKSLKKRIVSASIKLRKILSEEKIDTLVSCGAILGPLGVLGSIFSKVNHIYWDHSNFFQNGDHNFELIGKKITAKYANLVIPLTMADEHNYKTHSKAKKVKQIYNPIDELLTQGSKTAYNNTSNKIISVGRLGKQKNFLGLVDVAETVLKANPNWEWHIFGKGPEKNKIEDKIKEKGLEDHLKLKGHSLNLYEEYKNYSFLVMTSEYEGFPMTLLEGSSKNLPLISYDIATGPNEIIIDGTNGFLIDFENKHKMSEKIIYLINNEATRRMFSSNQKSVVPLFELKTIVKKWLEVL